METYILHLFFWTEIDGETDMDLMRQYRIQAVSKDVAWTVADEIMEHEPLLSMSTADWVTDVELDLERKHASS